MVAQDEEDTEGRLIEEVRRIVGERVLHRRLARPARHPNPTRMIGLSDANRRLPHPIRTWTWWRPGRGAARLLLRILDGEARAGDGTRAHSGTGARR